ncbi:venom metalloproteinase antarease TserMP_A [Rhipicephalus sanguineus]|uniref:venom metalloproteinase antarease TserMP_A n=1 Tax=Rhipicephalus sanguineus TaxID=34632 RepID=UPI0020C356EC|nr:venom metalloproteinase antarease TserMP_A [Rhipicephalus sanguineus]
MEKEAAMFSDADVVVLLTSDPFGTLLPGGAVRYGPIGSAAAGGACTSYRAAVITEQPMTLTGVLTVAHEVTHLLGSAHDGQAAPSYLKRSPGAQSCPNDAKHIMSTYRESNIVATFSQCSLAQVMAFLRESWAQCLLTDAPRHSVNVVQKKFSSVLRDPNDICEELHPKSSSVKFLQNHNEHDIKKCHLLCADTSGGVTTIYRHKAPEYTLCDISAENRTKVCVQMNCTDILSQLTTFRKTVKEAA